MENLAFLHAHAGYEDPSETVVIRSFEEMGLRANSIFMSVGVGFASGLIVLGHASAIQALVKLGDRGVAVSNVQSKLNNLGYNAGSVDGVFGPNTRKAVTNFQAQQGLAVDGVVGPNTAVKLGLPASDYGGVGGPNNGSTAKVVTNGNPLNIRTGPGTGYKVMGTLSNGSTVQVFGYSNGWYKLANGGWISSAWTVGGIGSDRPSTPAQPTPSGRIAIATNGSELLARSGPGQGNAVTGWYYNGAIVRFYDYNGGWYKTDKGWVSGRWVDEL